MKNFKAGMAKADITPPIGTLLYGYPSKRISNNVLDPISVNALAVCQNDQTVLFVSAEICCMNLDNCRLVIQAVSEATGVKPENILYSSIHTHSAPITRTSAGWGTADTKYVDEILIPKSIETAKKAVESMKDAVMAVGQTESYLGINRRQIKDGEVILGQNPDGPYNPKMTVLVFKGMDESPIGTLIHFAVHPTCGGENLSISRDWPGYMIDRAEQITNAPCMYINGAEGDIGPRLSNGRTTGAGDEKYIEETGRIAEKDIEVALNNATEFSVPTLNVHSESVSLPFIEMPPLQDVLAKMEQMGDPEKLVAVDITTYARLEKIKKMYETAAEFPTSLPLTQTVVALGDIAITPLPFEAFCNIALNLQEKSPFKETLVFGLTGGSFGYLPTEDQIPYGGYEIDSFKAATIPGFIESLDKHIVAENVRLLNKLY